MNVMGRLRRAIILVAGIVACASPCSAKVIKFEIVRVESSAFEGRSCFGEGEWCDNNRSTIAFTATLFTKYPGSRN